MSQTAPRRTPRKPQAQALIFAALGDQTRLCLVAKLADGRQCSIAQLTLGTALTRQAVTKHLQVLEGARLVQSVRAGRESLFELDPRRIEDARRYLDDVSAQWDQALARLKAFVER
jgi:DNA-binding transcriptional ArsR family regulator